MGVPGSANFLLAGAQGYQIERSLRFNSADSAYLNRTPASAGNRKTWTWSGWVKRCVPSGSDNTLFFSGDSTNGFGLYLNLTGNLTVFARVSSVSKYIDSTVLYRDPSAWYHIVFALDTTQATASNRFKVYVNGVQDTTLVNSTQISQNEDMAWNNNVAHYLGYTTHFSAYTNIYLAECHSIDGQALTPSSFGETDTITGVWKPKRYAGTYGTNGFYLKFADNSGTTSTTLGKDSSGNGNNWTPNNFNVAITGSYASTWTGSATGSPSGVQDPLGAFLSNSPTIPDNSQAGGRRTYVNHNGGTSWLQFTPAAPISGTTLRVFTYQPQGTSGADTWLNINGGADIRPWRVAANYTGWSTNITIPGGSLTSIRGSLSYGGASGMSIFAIEIDGVILRNSNESIDSMIDVPTPYADGGNGRGNYATWNPLGGRSGITLSDGNLRAVTASQDSVLSTIGMSSGKWYAEFFCEDAANSRNIGLVNAAHNTDVPVGSTTNSIGYNGNGIVYVNNSTVVTYASYTTTDIIGVAFNADAGTVTFYKNGTLQGTPSTSLTSYPYFFAASDGTGTAPTWVANFGQRPFAYTPPSGFKALNTQNLPEPSIKKPNQWMDINLATGNNSTQTITNAGGFQPDLVWMKIRSAAENHILYDSARGTDNFLVPNLTNAAAGGGGQGLTSFNSNGFTLGNINPNYAGSPTFVAWQWKESATPGFDIVTYTGTGSARTIAHSLGVAPQFIIVKNRSNGTANWQTGSAYHNATSPWNYYMRLNTTAAAVAASTIWNNTAPTSSVFSVGTDGEVNANGDNYVAYLWSEVAGFSKFGSYTGNGSSDGPFVYCGFRPRWVMVKRTNSTGNWYLYDTAREGYNVMFNDLCANLSNAENVTINTDIDVVSNGFKLRGPDGDVNYSGHNYIFAAFAESPFKYSLAR